MGRKQISSQPPLHRSGRRIPARGPLHAGRDCRVVTRCVGPTWAALAARTATAPERGHGQRGPPFLPKEQGRWVDPPALTMPHAVRNFSQEGITRAITTVYYRASPPGNRRSSAVFPALPPERAMTGILALACLATGFIIAWLLRTGYVMAQISWAQEQMERKVRYWQGEAVHARVVAEDLLRQLEAATGRPAEPTDWPGPDTDWRRPDST